MSASRQLVRAMLPSAPDEMVTSGGTTARNDGSTSIRGEKGSFRIEWVHPGSIARRTPLDGGNLVMGRVGSAETCLDHPSVSRQHLEIRRQGPILTLRDLKSTNGTYLNGERMSHSALAPGDVLRVGDCIGIAWQGPELIAGTSFGAISEGLLGGATLARALHPARAAAHSTLPVLLLGETGTGKECAARAVHLWSGRSGRFCAINCAALPENLAEAELFGYRRGAFTGSERSSPGLFRAADQGTLLLDEIGDLSPAIQAKLLRVIEQREVLPLGETTPVPLDVRIIAAGQLSLVRAVETGAFREDLFARLSGITVEMTPLRNRREDVLPLFLHYLAPAAGGLVPELKPRLAESLCLYDWPRNVRELKLTAEYLGAIHGQEATLKLCHLPSTFPVATKSTSELQPRMEFGSRQEQDLHRLANALKDTNGNLKAAAASLGMSRARAYRILANAGLEKKSAAANAGIVIDRR